MKYKAVLFDFDYTLADSSRGIVTCFQNVLRHNGYADITDETIKRTIGLTLEKSFTVLTGITDEDAIADLKKQYGKQADTHMTVNTLLFPDTLSVLNRLKEKGLKLGIISTKFRFRIMEFVDKHFPSGFFDVIIGGEDVTNHKPDPEGLLTALNKLGATPQEVLYVGDSVVDAETAINAQTAFVGVTTGMTTKDELAVYANVAIISRLNELPL